MSLNDAISIVKNYTKESDQDDGENIIIRPCDLVPKEVKALGIILLKIYEMLEYGNKI